MSSYRRRKGSPKTNVRKFTKDFPLYPSGLLGLVTLESVAMPER